MVINIFGAIAVVTAYWCLWYGAAVLRRKLPPVRDNGLKILWRFNAAALFSSGACFVAAALLNASGSGDKAGQAIAAGIAFLVIGLLGATAATKTVKVKAAEVAAAKIPGRVPSGYTVKTTPDPNPTTYVPSFAEKIGVSRADSIIDEIKAGSW